MRIAIMGHVDYRLIGGTQTKAINMLTFLPKYHDIDYYITVKNHGENEFVFDLVNGVIPKDISPKTNVFPFKPNREFKKMLKNNEYDLFILLSHTALRNRKLYNNPKVIYVQSMDWEYTEFSRENYSDKIKLSIDQYLFDIYNKKNPLDYIENVVYFTEKHNKKHIAKHPFYLQNPCDSTSYIENKERSGGVFAGRIDYAHKGLKRIEHIKDIDIFGSGNDIAKISKSSRYKGKYSKFDMSKILAEYRYFVSSSNKEGFQNTLPESLLAGVPLIIGNDLDQSDFYKNLPFVKIIDWTNESEINAAIEYFNSLSIFEWENLSKLAIDFAKEKFSIKTYEKKWIDIIEKVKNA